MSDTADRVKKIVVEHLGVEEEKVTPDASFIDDLGADSLDAKVFDNDLLHAVGGIAHVLPSRNSGFGLAFALMNAGRAGKCPATQAHRIARGRPAG